MMRTRPSLPDIPRNNVLLDFVAKEMLPGKSKSQELGTGKVETREEGDTSDFDFSPLTPSDQRITVGHHQNTEEALLNQGDENEREKGEGEEDSDEDDGEEDNGEGDGDVCSLDEGLGGISDSDIADVSTKETGNGLLSSGGENNCNGDGVKAEEPASYTEDQMTEEATAEQSFSSGSEDGVDEPPPLPKIEPPRNPELERKPSRIPKKIQHGSPAKSCETEAEKGSKEAEGEMEKGDNLKERAFSPERRPSRISFETML